MDEDGVSVLAACPETCCDACAGACEDSTTWYSKKPKRDCSYVAKKAAKRCSATRTDGAGVSAPVACCATCDVR